MLTQRAPSRLLWTSFCLLVDHGSATTSCQFQSFTLSRRVGTLRTELSSVSMKTMSDGHAVDRLSVDVIENLEAPPCIEDLLLLLTAPTVPLALLATRKLEQDMPAELPSSLNLGRVTATLPVRDIQKAFDTYNTLFGFEKTFENGSPVGFMILKRDDAELHLTLQPEHQTSKFNVAHMLVSVAAAAYALCCASNLRIIKRLQDKDYGLRGFVFEDVDGNRIDVAGPI